MSRQPAQHSGLGRARWLFPIALAVLLALLALAWCPEPSLAQSGGEDTSQPLRVVIKPLEPFVFVDGAVYRGFSIDLWQEIAARLGWSYEWQLVETVKDQLDAVEQNQADIAITGISITSDREEVVDFSLPYFRAGLQILTRVAGADSVATTTDLLWTLLVGSSEFLFVIASLALLIVLMGHVFWLLERRRNPDFPRPYLRGVWEGVWYTVVTLVTVGYGDRTAKSVPGRLVAIVWMFLSLFLVACFTAAITSSLTLRHIQSVIGGLDDLPGKHIATVANSTAAEYLDIRRLPYTSVERVEQAYDLLERGEVDAIVYDSPVLSYYASGNGQGKVQIVGELFELQYYGIALPAGSPRREAVNRTLLEILEDGSYDRIAQRWFETSGASWAKTDDDE